MAARVLTGTAFRWRPTAVGGEEADFVRVVEAGGLTLAALANGYEDGFSTCWPPGSRLLLDLFVEAWLGAHGATRARLHRAFLAASDRFSAQVSGLVEAAAALPDELPGAVLLAVVIDGDTAHMNWIGGDIALVARGASATAETTPHTLVEQLRRRSAGMSPPPIPDVVTRTIGPQAPDTGSPSYLSAELAPGDTVVLISRAALRGPVVSVADAVAAAARLREPQALAQRLADDGFTATGAAYAAIAALSVVPAS